MSEWEYIEGLSAVERMERNADYWEEEYSKFKRVEADYPEGLPKSLKICPTCAWTGETNLTYCHRKLFHTSPVRLNLVPTDKIEEVLS